MRFQGRDLKPYADSVDPELLERGTVYYTVTYFNEELTVPHLLPLMYCGRANEADFSEIGVRLTDSGDNFVFQLAETVGAPYNSEHFRLFGMDELAGVYTFEAALDELLRCSLRLSLAN